MGNICNILGNKTYEEEKIVIGAPIFSRFDIAGDIYKTDEIYQAQILIKNKTGLSRNYSLPNLYNQQYLINQHYPINQHYTINRDTHYNNSDPILSGFLNGIVISNILDDNL